MTQQTGKLAETPAQAEADRKLQKERQAPSGGYCEDCKWSARLGGGKCKGCLALDMAAEARNLPEVQEPKWFVGVLKERNGEHDYSHQVLLQVCGDPDDTLRNVAQAFYDDCGDPNGDGFYHHGGTVFVEPARVVPVDAAQAAVLEEVLSVYRDDAAIEWTPPSKPAGKLPEGDVSVIEVASLDNEHAANFSKPFICQHEDCRVVEFDAEDAACAYQRDHRIKNGMDPMTGEPVEVGKLPEFDVLFEDVGFTSSDLTDRDLSESEAEGFTATAIKEKAFPDGVVAVVRGYITEDDNQDGDEKKVFACVTLRVRAENEEAAEAFRPPKALLAKLADMMGTDDEGNLDLSLEGNWEVSVGSAESVDLANIGRPAGVVAESPYNVELCIRAAQQHGEDDDPDHEVGDLQEGLREMWKLLTPEQQAAYMASDSVIGRLELGLSSEEFDSLFEDVEEPQPSTPSLGM